MENEGSYRFPSYQIHRWFTHLVPRVWAGHNWSFAGSTQHTQHPSCGWKQRSTRNGCRFHKRKENKKHPPNLGKVKHIHIHIPPGKESMAIATPWVKNHGPLLLVTELGSDAEKPSTDSLRCSSFMAVQVVLGGFPYYIERNSSLVRVEWLRTIQFHVSRCTFCFFCNHCRYQCQHHQQKHRNQSYT